MHEVTAGDDVALSAEAVWAVIGDFGGIRKWAPAVESERTEQTDEGLFRILVMPGGREVRERLADSGPLHYTYTLPRPDMKTYLSTVAVEPRGGDAAHIRLTVRFEPADPAALETQTEALTKFCRGNLKAMKRALGLA